MERQSAALETQTVEVNAHIHTPYSFSSFSSLSHAFELAESEGVKVLGINDFYTAAGYGEFARLAKNYGIFPLFNMEFIGLNEEAGNNLVRINDPVNPGRIYLCGKGFNIPFQLPAPEQEMLTEVVANSSCQVKEMIRKTNTYFEGIGLDISLNYNELKVKYAQDLVRERHIATAIRDKIQRNIPDGASDSELWSQILNHSTAEDMISDKARLENLIRSRILKNGGPGYVEENNAVFLSVEALLQIILAGGGLPCYPVLLDDEEGNLTEFEMDWEQLYNRLIAMKILAVDLLPGRNAIKLLQNFVNFVNVRNFIITSGTEYNTPVCDPLRISGRHNAIPDRDIKVTGLKGAAVIAAHQYLQAKGSEGYNTRMDKPDLKQKLEFENLGLKILNWYFREYSKT